MNEQPTPSAAERRDSARSRIFVLVHAGASDEPMWAWDIGMSGMQCRSPKPRWPGTYLDLRFRLPETTEPIELGAQVVSMEPAAGGHVSLGLRFRAMSPKAQRAIYRFLDRRRALWEDEQRFEREAGAEAAEADSPRPFELLLREAYALVQQRKGEAAAETEEKTEATEGVYVSA